MAFAHLPLGSKAGAKGPVLASISTGRPQSFSALSPRSASPINQGLSLLIFLLERLRETAVPRGALHSVRASARSAQNENKILFSRPVNA